MADRLWLGGDLPVRRVGYGALLLRRAVEWGVELIDTADSYGLGANEELIAEALHPYSEQVVIATKVGQCRPAPGVWIPLGRPEYLRQQAELSLRRLRRDRLDLLQLHRVDPGVPFADQVGALRDLQVAGKVRHIGLSKVSAAQIDEAARIADIASVQNPYNVLDRAFEESLSRCAELGIAFLAWLPVKQGRLDKSPVAFMEKPPPGKRENVIDPETHAAMHERTSPEFCDLITVCWETGWPGWATPTL